MDTTNCMPGQAQSLDPGTWRCLVCTKPSNEMRVLPCQHKFCAPCLKLWAMIYIDMYNGHDDEFPCQVCWKKYAVPPQGLEAYEQNYQVKVLQETMKQMSMGHDEGQGRDPTKPGPFSFTPTVPQSECNVNMDHNSSARIHDEFSDYMQQPYDTNSALVAYTAEQATQMDAAMGQCQPSPADVTAMPSMVSHMAPQPYTGTQECLQENGRATGHSYCFRPCHMYMHMM